jgi:probable rRNA maturation factor
MVLNQQREVRIPIQLLERFLARARQELRLAPDSFTVCLVTNAAIARWNRSYRGKNRATDVLSFPAEGTPSKNRNSRSGGRKRARIADSTRADEYLGDIAIAPRVAQKNARAFGRTFDEELRILALHGVLHLMGYDHETDSGQMERRERRLRRALKLA